MKYANLLFLLFLIILLSGCAFVKNEYINEINYALHYAEIKAICEKESKALCNEKINWLLERIKKDEQSQKELLIKCQEEKKESNYCYIQNAKLKEITFWRERVEKLKE